MVAAVLDLAKLLHPQAGKPLNRVNSAFHAFKILLKVVKTLTRKCGISSSFSSCATPKIARALGLWSTTMRFTAPPRPLISRLRPRPRPACTDPGSIFPRPRPRPVGGLISPNRVAWKRKRFDAKNHSFSGARTQEPLRDATWSCLKKKKNHRHQMLGPDCAASLCLFMV